MILYEVEFDDIPGKRFPIVDIDDRYIEAAAIAQGLWSKGQEKFPGFTVLRKGEEIGGG